VLVFSVWRNFSILGLGAFRNLEGRSERSLNLLFGEFEHFLLPESCFIAVDNCLNFLRIQVLLLGIQEILQLLLHFQSLYFLFGSLISLAYPEDNLESQSPSGSVQ
jgi:hypothetical protein